jgi:hypothetical protein
MRWGSATRVLLIEAMFSLLVLMVKQPGIPKRRWPERSVDPACQVSVSNYQLRAPVEGRVPAVSLPSCWIVGHS